MRSALLIFGLSLALGCAQDDAPDGTEPIPDSMGALSISIVSATPLGSELMVVLKVDRTAPADKAQEAVVQRKTPLMGSMTVLETVYLEEGTYDVHLELQSLQGDVVLSGKKLDVAVIPGELSSIEVPLVPSGGIHVTAEIAPGGTKWEIVAEVEPDDPGYYSAYSITGTQRVVQDAEGGAKVEYLLFQYDADAAGIYRLHTADDPAALFAVEPLDGMKVTGIPSPGWNQENQSFGLAASGDDLYLTLAPRYGDVSIYRIAPDGQASLHAALEKNELYYLLPTSGEDFEDIQTSTAYGVRHCQLVIDNQFNLFCAVDYHIEIQTGIVHDTYITHTHSPDGKAWAPLLQYDMSGVDPEDVTYPYGDATMKPLPVWPHDKVPPLANGWQTGTYLYGGSSSMNFCRLHAMLDQGTYRIWSTRSTLSGSLWSYMASADRKSWGILDLDLVFGWDEPTVQGVAVFRKGTEYHMYYITDSEHWIHAKAVD